MKEARHRVPSFFAAILKRLERASRPKARARALGAILYSINVSKSEGLGKAMARKN